MSQRKLWVSIIAGTLLLATLGACSPAQPQQEQGYPAPPAFATEDPFLEVPRVTLEEAKAAFDSGSAVFVDTRFADDYAIAHIPGALSIPADEIESRLSEVDPDQWIITYCT
jgi:hypothetical protein